MTGMGLRPTRGESEERACGRYCAATAQHHCPDRLIAENNVLYSLYSSGNSARATILRRYLLAAAATTSPSRHPPPALSCLLLLPSSF